MTADHSWDMRLGRFFGGAGTCAVLDTTWNVGIFLPFHHIYQSALEPALLLGNVRRLDAIVRSQLLNCH
jgi:hypothetical protein